MQQRRAGRDEERLSACASVDDLDMPALVPPTATAVASFVDATRRHGGEDHPDYDLAAAQRAVDNPDGYIAALLADVREHAPRPAHWVASTHLWFVDGQTYLGRLQIRHRLTRLLREEGGHIGYSVVPEHRRRGHASTMLTQALPVAAAIGIECALVTCDADNVASRLIIERHGGLLQDQRGAKLR